MDFGEGAACDESPHDVLEYLAFAGFDLTRDQVARLARRRLIDSARLEDGGRGAPTWYPRGTAERLVRIAQLRQSTKQLDELAWRLWWEGFYVEPALVREYLARRARRWDELLAESEQPAPADEALEAPPATASTRGRAARQAKGRDVLEEVFFQHLKAGPATGAARRQLERGAALYQEFAELFVSLVHRFGEPDDDAGDLFDDQRDDPFAWALEPAGERADRRGERALATSFEKIVDSLEDDEMRSVRDLTRAVLEVVGEVGEIISDVFEGATRTREQVGKTLTALSGSPHEQALALLLTSALRGSDRLPASSEVVGAPTPPRPVISYQDFRRLQFLSDAIEGLAALLEPDRVRAAFASSASAEEWRRDFTALRAQKALEFEMAMDLAPELFEEAPPEDDDVELEELEEMVSIKKKNPK